MSEKFSEELFLAEKERFDAFLKERGAASIFKSRDFSDYLLRFVRTARDVGSEGVGHASAILRREGYPVLGSREGAQKMFEQALEEGFMTNAYELKLFLLHIKELPFFE